MGWLEVLALLKRLGPSLSRVLPMLETFIATRAGSSTNTEAFDRFTSEVKDQIAAGTANNGVLIDALSNQAKQIETVRNDLRHVREMDERAAARLLEVETQVSTLGKAVYQVRQLLMALLAVCLALLVAVLVLLLRR